MDKPTTPGGGDLSGFRWPEDSGSEQGFGATGVFGTLPAEEPAPKPAAIPIPPPAAIPIPPPAAEPKQPAKIPMQPFEMAAAAQAAKPSPPKIQTPARIPVLQEPVVHKVVLGTGTGEHPAELLDRIRMVSAERAAVVEKPTAVQPGGQGSGGFTELLRTLSGDAAAPPAKPAVVPGSASGGPAAPMSGFTSLLQTLNAPPAAAPVQQAPPPLDLPVVPVVPAPPVASPAPAPGGFTELLRMSDFGSPQPAATEPPLAGFGQISKPPAVGEAKPGTFTQLFGTFSAADAGVPVAPVLPPAPGFGRSGTDSSAPGSFTRMLSLEQQSGPSPFAPPPPVFRDEPVTPPGSVDYGRTPEAARPGFEASKPDPLARDPFAPDPFAQSRPPAPVESAPPVGGMGITRLIQMLDEPAQMPPAPAAPIAAPPAGSPAKAGPGIWTQTFESLSKSSEAAPPATPPPSSWSTPPPIVFTPAAPPTPPPPPLAQADERSEVTKIIDASRMREMALRGGGGQTPGAGASGAGSAAPPSFAPPAAPAPPQMPQPGGFAPPPPPAVAAAAAPKEKPAPPAAASKLQQFVPLMLVMIIVLLVVILVTVIFLMKH